MSETMGMSDKQYNGLLIDMIEDYEEIKDAAEKGDMENVLKIINKKIEKNRKKLES